MTKIKATTDSVKCGDIVQLRPNVDRIEVLNFHTQPYYFEAEDIGLVTHLDSPCMRYRKGKPDTQTVVKFSKKSVANFLVVRVDAADLELCKG
jgi:hypothetical protein